jgi:hypothetical protein
LPGISAPVVGNALNFDGVDDYVNCTNNAALQITTGTIEAWIKTSNAGSSYRGIVTKQSAYSLFLNNNILIAYDWTTGDRSTGINLADNAWHHVALSFNNGVANGSYIYIDGVLKLTTTYNISGQGVGLAIGAGYDSGSQNFAGNIDEVRVWNTNRTQAQIQATMNTELTGNEANLVAYYNINQGVAGGTNTGLTTLTNKTTYPVNGTLNNFALSGATSNYVTGNVSASGMAAITGTLSVCAPGAFAVNTTQLSHPVAGGVWTSSDPTKATINSSTGLVTGVAAGTTTITYTLTSPEGCTNSKTAVVTVNPVLVPSVSIAASANPICNNGTSVTFTATPTNGGTTPIYQWKKNGVNVGTNSPTYTISTLVNGDVITCVMTSNATCYSVANVTSNSITETVNDLPVVSINPALTVQNLCQNATATSYSVTASAGSGTISNYKWYSNTTNSNTGGTLVATNTSSLTTNSYTPSTTATGALYYYCVVTNSNGCIATSTTSGLVTVVASPTITTTGTINTLSYSSSNQSGTLPYTATANTPISYSIDWDATANAAGLADQASTAFTFAAGGGNLTGIVITPATTGITFNGVMTIKNATGCTSTQAVRFSLLNVLDVVGLNSTTPAASAYGLRKLSTAYSGPLVRITIGSNFYDVYPDTNTVFSLNSKISAAQTTYNAAIAPAGTNALSTVVTGATNATVAIWYDQSGWGRNLTQATTSAQPTIITSGAIRTRGTTPTLFLDSADDGMTSAAGSYINATPVSVNLVAGQNGTGNGARRAVAGSNNWLLGPYSNLSSWHADGWNHQLSPQWSTTGVETFTVIEPAATANTSFRNGISQTAGNNKGVPGAVNLAASGAYGERLDGYVSELITFNLELTTANRQAIECNQGGYYGLIVANCATSIVTQPVTTPQTKCKNSPATQLKVEASGANLTYQWYSNTTASTTGATLIPGATSAAFTPSTAVV